MHFSGSLNALKHKACVKESDHFKVGSSWGREKRDKKSFLSLDLSKAHKIIKKFFQEHIIKMLKFGQKEVTTKDFYGQQQITNLLTIDVNKVVVSDKVSCNDGKDCLYIIGYQVDGALIRLQDA